MLLVLKTSAPQGAVGSNPTPSSNFNYRMTEKEKYFDWLAKEKAKGLLGINFYFNHDAARGMTEEQVYAELNRMNEAPDVPDPEVLGKYCPLSIL